MNRLVICILSLCAGCAQPSALEDVRREPIGQAKQAFNIFAHEEDLSAARSLDLTDPGYYMAQGLIRLTLWAGPSVTEIGSTYGTISMTSGGDRLGNAMTQSYDGAVDGSSATSIMTEFLVDWDGSSSLTLDFGYFSPFGGLRYDYFFKAVSADY